MHYVVISSYIIKMVEKSYDFYIFFIFNTTNNEKCWKWDFYEFFHVQMPFKCFIEWMREVRNLSLERTNFFLSQKKP